MGLSKAILFSEEQNRLANLAKVFAHPARIAIIEFLFKNQTCLVNTLLEELPLSQSTISQHLKEMKNAGIIRGEVDGTNICYCLNSEVMLELSGKLNKLLGDINKCC
jgi:predicted transcriptional regulator